MSHCPAFLKQTLLGLGTFAGVCCAANAAAYPFDLQMRSTGVPNSCEYSVFEPEVKITNVETFPINLSSVFVEFAFNAGLDEIEAVHERVTVGIFNADGGFHSWNGATVRQQPWDVNIELSDDRKANQVWATIFDPPSPHAPTTLIPAGGYAAFYVTLRRAGGVTPFDENCDDFSKVDVGTPHRFIDNDFFHMLFTSTQQLICEQKSPTSNDPLSGRAFWAPFTSGC
jgi:hypothetical protein